MVGIGVGVGYWVERIGGLTGLIEGAFEKMAAIESVRF